MRIRMPMVLLTTVVFAGLVTQSPAMGAAAAEGTTSYSNWTWSFSGASADPWVPATVRGTNWHQEGGGWSGISVQIKGNEPNVESTVRLQRDLSWSNDGYVTIATVHAADIDSWVRDNKRYQVGCSQYVRYRIGYGTAASSLYSSKIYPDRGIAGEAC